MRPSRSRCLPLLASVPVLLAAASPGCGKETKVEGGALLLELSVAGGVSTPDELRVSVYDDGGTLWKDARVPGAGALVPESATRLGTVLIQPGTTQGGLRVHVRGFVASTRVADGTLAISTRGQYALQLDVAVPADADGDDVPDAIDDCPAVANSGQGGCPGNVDGGGDGGNGDSGDGRGGDVGGGDVAGGNDGGADVGGADVGGGTDALNCGAGGCNRTIGAACTDGMQCTSSFCVDGVCCMNACIGPCRSCNQPNLDGMCQAYGQGADPAGECTGGATCNGAGACGPPMGGPKPNGQLCGAGTECTSGFCKDGVCCNNACDTPCRTCETGTCVDVKRKPDPPECYGTLSCNPTGKCQ
jgi:hypothetical protein